MTGSTSAPGAPGLPGPSYWHQVGEQPLVYGTLGQLTAHAARAHGQREAIICVQEGVRLDFQQLQQRVRDGDGPAGAALSHWLFDALTLLSCLSPPPARTGRPAGRGAPGAGAALR